MTNSRDAEMAVIESVVSACKKILQSRPLDIFLVPKGQAFDARKRFLKTVIMDTKDFMEWGPILHTIEEIVTSFKRIYDIGEVTHSVFYRDVNVIFPCYTLAVYVTGREMSLEKIQAKKLEAMDDVIKEVDIKTGEPIKKDNPWVVVPKNGGR